MRLARLDNPTTEPSQPEPRRHLAVPITVLKVDADHGPKTFFGYAKNISRHGMMIGTTNPREPGSRYRLEIPLPEPLNVVARCTCEVVWQRCWNKEECHEPGMGLRFLDLPEEIAAAIEAWISHESLEEILWN